MGRTVFMWYKVVLAVASVKIVLKCEHSKKKKAAEQCFVVRHAVFMWYRVVLAFASVEIILQCEHSNQSC